MFMVKSKFTQISRNFATVAKHRRVPTKYKPIAVEKAQKAVTDYLHTTRSLSYAHAEHIATNASVSIRNLIVKLDFSVRTFPKSLRKHLRYHPINEFEFFFESIGIDYDEVNEYLPEKKFFFYEDRSVLDSACALSAFGFPWNKLGKLYKEEKLVFLQSPQDIRSFLLKLKGFGFSTFAIIGICLAIPRTLCGGRESDDEISCLFVKLKRLFEEFDSDHLFDDNVDSWYDISRKIRVFYDLGHENEEMWELMGRNKSLFVEYTEEALIEKTEYFCRFGVIKEDATLMILRNPDVMSFDLEKPMISVTGMLKHLGLSQEEVDDVAKRYPYVLGRNKMKNLPHVLRAIDLHKRIFDMLMHGAHHLLANYPLIDPEEDIDREYQEGLKEIQQSRYIVHNIQKLDFFHEIGFGENSITMKMMQHVHGTALELHSRFQILRNNGIEFSKTCHLISSAPKILNQKPDSIQDKIKFLGEEMGNPLEHLEAYPAYLCFDLEYRINPRFRFYKWLMEKGLSERSYSVASIVATSEKAFIARLFGIHPAIPKHWFERFSNRKTRHAVS